MPTVQEALQRHKAVLNENLELWKFIDANGGLDESTKRIVSQGYQDTLAMITAWAELETTLSTPKKSKSSKQGSKRLSTDQDSAPTPKSKRRRVNGEHGDTQGSAAASTETVPVVDASGLFMIDPNPTNVDTLLGQNQGSAAPESQKKKKRRRSEQQDDDDHQSQPGVAEPKSRSKRRRSDSAGKSSERAEPNVEDPDSFKNNSRQDQDTHHEAFEAKVALRLKEKEDQRKKKVQKKRKRSSEASTAADDDIASDDDEPKKTRKPRAKKAKSVNAAGIETGSRRRKRSRS